MTYVIPQVQVFQDFQTSTAAQANPLQAHISGPHAQLIRFNQSDEQALGQLDYYDPLSDTAYNWPNRPAGGLVDQSYTKLWVQNALLQYFAVSVSGSSDITTTSGFTNRVSSASVNFQTANGDARDEVFLDRDVALGDIVQLRFVPDEGSPTTLWSYVNGFAADISAAVTGDAAADTSNTNTASVSASTVQIQGPFNAVDATASAASYDPFPTGQITETYTVIVTQSSTGADYTQASLRVISASGLDDDADVTPATEDTFFNIGSHGVQLKFNSGGGMDASESAVDQGIAPNALVAGQRWTVTVTANYTKAVATAGGTYAGATDTTYVVEVVQGAKYATAAPQIKVSTTTGVDISGPTAVPAAASAVAVGTQGLTIQFSGTGLALGDRYTIAATAQAPGAVRTLVLGHNIPSAIAADTPCDLTLYIKNPALAITQNRTGYAPLTNFDTSATQITVNSGILAYDPTWTDEGVPVALPLAADAGQNYGLLFVEYRAWVQTLVGDINGISDVGDINTLISGALDPDNPLKWAVFQALTNSNGTQVMFTSVADPDNPDTWADVLSILDGYDGVYSLVPLTYDSTVLGLYAAHVADESSPESGLWRCLWVNLQDVPTIPIVSTGSTIPRFTSATTTDGQVCLATIQDDPNTEGTQYTVVTVPAGNAQFIANGVQAGDIVRTLFTGDGFGNITYSEFVVDLVQSEDQLLLLSGPDSPVNSAAKIEIWRNLSATDDAAQIALTAGSWGNRRIRAVWPDQVGSSGTIMAGYHLCAALAGLASGILPHQGMTNLAITGYDDITRTTKKFNKTQLDAMAVAGTWIVTQAPQTGTVFTRQAVTTANYASINDREEMVVRNVDSISFRFKDTFAPFIGVTNVTPSAIQLIQLQTISLIEVLKQESYTAQLGGQLIDAQIVELRPHATLADRIVLVLNAQVPAPDNNIDVHLVIGGTATASSPVSDTTDGSSTGAVTTTVTPD